MTERFPTSICVFCGSRTGRDPRYAAATRGMGQLLAQSGITLVYGGGRVGLMGELADACLQAGGRVIGVIPQMLLDREVGHAGLTELEVVASLSVRKQRMSDLAQAFWTAIVAFVVCVAVTICVSLCTEPAEDEQLCGLVYSLTPRLQVRDEIWYRRPEALAAAVLLGALALNLWFF